MFRYFHTRVFGEWFSFIIFYFLSESDHYEKLFRGEKNEERNFAGGLFLLYYVFSVFLAQIAMQITFFFQLFFGNLYFCLWSTSFKVLAYSCISPTRNPCGYFSNLILIRMSFFRFELCHLILFLQIKKETKKSAN